MKKYFLFIVAMFAVVAATAFGQDASSGLHLGLGDLPWLSKIVPVVLAVMGALRGVAEVLKAVSVALGNAQVGAAGAAISKACDWLGSIIGWFGVGSPQAGK